MGDIIWKIVQAFARLNIAASLSLSTMWLKNKNT